MFCFHLGVCLMRVPLAHKIGWMYVARPRYPPISPSRGGGFSMVSLIPFWDEHTSMPTLFDAMGSFPDKSATLFVFRRRKKKERYSTIEKTDLDRDKFFDLGVHRHQTYSDERTHVDAWGFSFAVYLRSHRDWINKVMGLHNKLAKWCERRYLVASHEWAGWGQLLAWG